MLPCFSHDAGGAGALHLVTAGGLADWRRQHPAHDRWLGRCGHRGEPGSFCVLPGDGAPEVLATLPDAEPTWALGGLPLALPEGRYVAAGGGDAASWLGWALGAYQFDRYKPRRRPPAALVLPAGAAADEAERLAHAVGLARDLINTPAEDMGPAELAAAANGIVATHGGRCEVITGRELLERGYPAIHLVGRASPREPRLIDLRWGDPAWPKVTLVGKGVCFDTGGLDLKSHDGMLEMKKDMAGAAIVLGLAQALMAAGTRLRLRVLVPACDNTIAGDAMRPRDIVRTRAGKTVEIGFTDAEGRLVLCDALAEACSEAPELVIDVATLTGAAKAALGSEVQALFSDDDDLAAELVRCSLEVGDPLWRLPIWRPYRRRIDSPCADLSNVARGLFADAIVATLYLSEFVPRGQRWVHLDVMGMNTLARPGRPEGGEATGLLALHTLLQRRYGSAPSAGGPR